MDEEEVGKLREKLYGSDEEDGGLHNEEQVITLYSKLYKRINADRRDLFDERSKMSTANIILGMIFCCGCSKCCTSLPKPINLFILLNYIYSVMKQYKGYWLLLLPYNYEIRPLSVWCSGRSITENIVKYDYKKAGWFKTLTKGLKFFYNACIGIACFFCCFLGFMALLYVSIGFNEVMDGSIWTEYDSNQTVTTKAPASNLHYPICDLKWNANLSVVDLSVLAKITYEVGEPEIEHNITLEQEICVYFDRKFPGGKNGDCSWKLIHVTESEPVFFHIRHDKVELTITLCFCLLIIFKYILFVICIYLE